MKFKFNFSKIIYNILYVVILLMIVYNISMDNFRREVDILNYDKLISLEIEYLIENTRFEETKKYIQHGNTSVYEHSVKVAYMSCYLVEKLGIKVNSQSMIRGALLHDYFLYDWHDGNAHEGLHGFRHPYKALKNAKEDLVINHIEENIILRHMFPLVPIPPACKESWIVTLADKISAMEETMVVFKNRFLKINRNRA